MISSRQRMSDILSIGISSDDLYESTQDFKKSVLNQDTYLEQTDVELLVLAKQWVTNKMEGMNPLLSPIYTGDTRKDLSSDKNLKTSGLLPKSKNSKNELFANELAKIIAALKADSKNNEYEVIFNTMVLREVNGHFVNCTIKKEANNVISFILIDSFARGSSVDADNLATRFQMLLTDIVENMKLDIELKEVQYIYANKQLNKNCAMNALLGREVTQEEAASIRKALKKVRSYDVSKSEELDQAIELLAYIYQPNGFDKIEELCVEPKPAEKTSELDGEKAEANEDEEEFEEEFEEEEPTHIPIEELEDVKPVAAKDTKKEPLAPKPTQIPTPAAPPPVAKEQTLREFLQELQTEIHKKQYDHTSKCHIGCITLFSWGASDGVNQLRALLPQSKNIASMPEMRMSKVYREVFEILRDRSEASSAFRAEWVETLYINYLKKAERFYSASIRVAP